MEKQAEYKTYTQSIPQTDRMDYLAPMCNNLALCLAAEKLLGIEAPARAQAIRVLLTELTRISAHCVWLGTHAHRHRRDDGVLVLLPRAREGALDLRHGVAARA